MRSRAICAATGLEVERNRIRKPSSGRASLPVRPTSASAKARAIYGERFLATTGESLAMAEIAAILKQRMGPVADRVSTRVLPNVIVRSMALTNPAMKGMVPLLGVSLDASGEKAKRLLGWAPRSREDAIVATAESLLQLGLIG